MIIFINVSLFLGLATGRKTQGMDVYRDVYVHCLDKNLKRCQLVDGLPDVYPELKPKKSQWKLQDPQLGPLLSLSLSKLKPHWILR